SGAWNVAKYGARTAGGAAPACTKLTRGAALPSYGNPCTLDQCDGTRDACQHPAGNAGAVCRAGSGDACDPDEVCTGTSTSCPADVVQSSSFVCRTAGGECDVAENCPGTAGGACPADAKKTSGAACTADRNPCTLDQCDGTHVTCQHPAGNMGAICRAAADSCDVAETCTGSSAACPADNVMANGTPCPDDLNPCTNDVCNGTDKACHHPSWPAGTSCENSDNTVCTADVWNGLGVCIHTSQNARCDDHNDCTV